MACSSGVAPGAACQLVGTYTVTQADFDAGEIVNTATAQGTSPAGEQPTDDAGVLTDGERICSTAIGWNFGDGHLSNEQLIASLQKRCAFEPGEVRIVLVDAQPIHTQTQQYRLIDAATGEFERGYVRVADLVTRQPWDDEVPVTVTWTASPADRQSQ